MHKHLEDLLVKKYPTIFKRHGGDMKDTCMHWGIAVGDGWFKIIDELCEKLSKYPEIVAEQVKEKFGGLRFYIDGVPSEIHDEIYNIIAIAEDKSFKTCETCGKEGKPIKGGWIKIQCVECFEKKELLDIIRTNDCQYIIEKDIIKIFNKEEIVFQDTLEEYIKLTEQLMGLIRL
jgi:hypothetical protein